MSKEKKELSVEMLRDHAYRMNLGGQYITFGRGSVQGHFAEVQVQQEEARKHAR